jgi:hypothetical protein
MMKKSMLWSIAVIAVATIAFAGNMMSNVEQARYTLIEAEGAIEIRDYAPMIVAETQVSGERKAAIREGFRILADYIFGNNLDTAKVPMTAPVIQQSSTKIAMTAPVIQQGEGANWTVRFVMPAHYTLQTLPKPNNPAVELKEISAKRFVTIRFSGLADEKMLNAKTALLEDFIAERKLHTIASPVYAFFNPPWTLPFLRRNEVMVEIE